MRFKIDGRITKAKCQVKKYAIKYEAAYNRNPKAVQIHRKFQILMTQAQKRLTALQLTRDAMVDLIMNQERQANQLPWYGHTIRWMRQVLCWHNDYVRVDNVKGIRERFCTKCGNVRPIF